MLRKIVPVLAAAVVAGPAMAADLNTYGSTPVYADTYVPPMRNVVAHLEAGVGVLSADGDSLGIYLGAGRLNIPTSGAWNVLVDIGNGAVFDGGYSGAYVSPVGHLWHGDGQRAYGIFGGVSFGGLTTGIIGVEAEHYFGSSALGAQAAYNFTSQEDFGAFKVWYDHYFHANLKGTLQADYITSSGFDAFRLNGTLERRHDNSPVSGFLSVSYLNGDGEDAWAGMLGMRFFSDAPGTTLYDHDMQTPFKYEGLGAIGGAGGYYYD